jgi:hypothetical protein
MPMKITIAEFSKSVIMMSMERNSTLQPISEVELGGGLKRREFQFVDWMFSKCDVVDSLSKLSMCSFSYVGIGSLTKRDPMWKASLSFKPVCSFRN